ncbi:Quinate dehydrogenase [Lachnellula hyalina]|uniref:Quinate dehydrogenase n=1 Tax=Lachnellula hyalina TaxID=1316788 RepID=A0A8H8R845_9HELO|nr:Quinate dehydrogenase [Lachnellula hyalina]TVY30334.1 Quinate dehydrogenase [Lachnellula hyalina]
MSRAQIKSQSTFTLSPPVSPAAPPVPSNDHLDRVSYLFGHPISHSLSPLLHDTIYSALDLNYAQHLYETRSLTACLALTHSPKFFGASVTMPHKVAIIPFLDMLTPEGEAIGAVNTIFWRNHPDGRRLLCGTNTDCIGIREAILQNVSKEAVSEMRGRGGMVIGGGGTCRAAVYTLKTYIGCDEVYLVNRDRSEVEQVVKECKTKGFGDGLRFVESVEEAERLLGPKVVVSAIPDIPPKSEAEIRTRNIVQTLLGKKEKGVILEMCYHPSPDTAIARIARTNEWQVIEGTEAMIWQGLEQEKVWLRKVSALPVDKVKQVIAAKLSKPSL